ncbi:hypothetical protein PAMP_001193 [Pampus punctatissimus]
MTGIPETMNETNTSWHCSNTQDGAAFMLIVMIIEIIVGLPGNIMAMWIFCFYMKVWKPHTLYLFNMVLADFLVLVSVPFRVDAHMRGDIWVFGEVWCRINFFTLAVNRSASIAFMTIVALDRYFKVVHPLHSISRMTTTQAGKIAVLIWTLVIALRIPLLTINLLHQEGNLTLCRSFNSYKVTPLVIKMHYVVYTVEFFLPWFWLLFCSARITCYLRQQQTNQQKRLRKAIIAVVGISLVFTICFLPAVITGLCVIHYKTLYPDNCVSYKRIILIFIMCISVTYLNSALDPFIYSFSSSMFRDALRSAMSHVGFVKRKAKSTELSMRTE